MYITSDYCTIKITLIFYRLGETCNHVAAVLFKIDYAWQWGTNNKACTSKPCVWNVRGGKKAVIQPKKISELKIMRPHYSKGGMVLMS